MDVEKFENKTCEYDQEMPQSQITYQQIETRGRCKEHTLPHDSINLIKAR